MPAKTNERTSSFEHFFLHPLTKSKFIRLLSAHGRRLIHTFFFFCLFRESIQKETLAAASSLLNSRAFRDLIDFDLHLDDIRQDWKNLEINELVEHTS